MASEDTNNINIQSEVCEKTDDCKNRKIASLVIGIVFLTITVLCLPSTMYFWKDNFEIYKIIQCLTCLLLLFAGSFLIALFF